MGLPIPKLDDRTFEQLVEEGRKLIPIYAPRWTNHNLSDTGITLMDLFAWLTEMQVYNLDFISEAHLLKYLGLLGMRPRPASAARVELQFTATEPIDCITILKGTPFKTDSTVFPLIFESEEDIEVIPIDLKEVLSYSNYRFTDVTEFNDHPQTYFHAFGEHPEEGDALYLGFDLRMAFKYLAGRTLRLAVYPYEDDLPPVGEGLAGEDKTGFRVYPSAEVIWELWLENEGRWVALTVTAADDNVPVLSRKGLLSLIYDDSAERASALFPRELKQYPGYMWIRCRLKMAGYEIPPRIDRILPNVVPAVEGESEKDIDLKEVLSYSNYTFTRVTEFNEHAKTYFHAFGEHPKEGDALYLGFDLRMAFKYPAGKTLRLEVYPYEDDLPPVGEGLAGEDKLGFQVHPSVEVIWELWKAEKKQWVPLKVTAEDENIPVLSRKGVLFLEYDDSLEGPPAVFPPALAQTLDQYKNPLWIRCRLQKAGYEIPPRIDRILPNVVPAVEGESEEDEWKSSGLPDQVFKTGKYPIVPGSQSVKIENKKWEAVVDFDASGPGDRHYVMEPGKGEIRFSNGVNGAVPPQGKNITISYCCGGGIKGNVKAGTITIKGPELTGITVTNQYPAYGGEEAESVKNAFIRLKRNLEVPYTAVTAGDYEYIAKATPGLRVARARAIIPVPSDSQPIQKEVTVVVMPYSFSENPLPGEAFKQTVQSYLDLHRLVTTVVTVSDPDYVKVSVSGEIKVTPGYDAEQIKKRTAEALDRFLSPLKRKSGDNEWPFGRAVYTSEINEVMEGVEGVDCVTTISLSGSGGSFEIREGNIEIGPLSLVYPGAHEIRVFDPYEKCRLTKDQGQQ